MRNRKINISDFYCCSCGKRVLPLPRKDGQGREPGHLKKLYCLYCKEEKNAVEIRENGKYTYEDFMIEYLNGNFDENGKRIQPMRQFIASHWLS